MFTIFKSILLLSKISFVVQKRIFFNLWAIVLQLTLSYVSQNTIYNVGAWNRKQAKKAKLTTPLPKTPLATVDEMSEDGTDSEDLFATPTLPAKKQTKTPRGWYA